MQRIFVSLFLGLLLLVGCSSGNNQPTLEPLSLLTEAANNIRDKQTFRLYVEHSGANYSFAILQGTETLTVQFRFARAQYVAPDTLQATARVIAAGIPIDVGVFSRGDSQWYQLPGAPWLAGEFAPGFNPATLIAEDSGFQAALTALQELQYVGEESLEDGTPVYHLKGIANGPAVTALVVGLIQSQSTIPVDVYIHRETRLPVRLVLTQPETATETEPDPTTWTIDVYDVDAPSELTPPEGATQE